MSGYSELGGSLWAQGVAGFIARSLSATEDIMPSRQILISRARILDMSSPIARAALDRFTNGIIGSGLTWNKPVRSDFFSGDEFDKFCEDVKFVQKRMRLWSMTHACDLQRRLTFSQMQRIICRNWLLSGDIFLVRRPPEDNRPSGWRLIESDRCWTPRSFTSSNGFGLVPVNPENGNKVFDGVEVNEVGAPVAYYFGDAYEDDNLFIEDPVRIPAYTDDGLPLVLHIFSADRPDQFRGVPMVAPVIEAVYGTQCYAQSELQSAIMESCFALFVTTNTNSTTDPFSVEESENLDKPIVPEPDWQLSPKDMTSPPLPGLIRKASVIGPGESRRLRPGESIQTVDPKRPSSGYEAFVKAQYKVACAAMGIPEPVVMCDYSSETYAGAHAAVVEASRTFQQFRTIFIEMVIRPILEVFARETLGHDSDDISKIIALESTWTGPSNISLDPKAELEAFKLALEMGLVSNDEVAQSLYGHPARTVNDLGEI